MFTNYFWYLLSNLLKGFLNFLFLQIFSTSSDTSNYTLSKIVICPFPAFALEREWGKKYDKEKVFPDKRKLKKFLYENPSQER